MNIFKHITRGSLVKGSGMLILLAGAQGAQLSRWGTFKILTAVPLWWFGILASLGGVLFFLGPMIFGSASVRPKARSAKNSQSLLFLYLRPFELDARNILQLLVGTSTGILVCLISAEGLWWPICFAPLVINISKEQSFQDIFQLLGEFIAFGKPMERLQPIGASRVYVEGDWRREVVNYMAQARLVILRPGESESIRWEVEQVLKTAPPERILFYLRFRGWKRRREKAYESFRSHLQTLLPKELPKRQGKAPYLLFDAFWNPYFISEANHPAQIVGQLFSHSGDITRYRLRPVLKALDIELPAQRHNLLHTVITVVLWLITLIIVGLIFAIIILGMILLALFFFKFL